VIVSRDVIVDERAKGSKPRSEFEVSSVEAPGEKPGLNGEPARAAQNPREESPNGRKDEKKDGEVEEDTGETEEIGETGESGDGVEKRYPFEREGRPESGTGQTWRRTGKRRSRKPTRRRWRDPMPSFGKGRWTRSSRRCWRTERESLRSCRTASRRCP
jgi:hypothetical protein